MSEREVIYRCTQTQLDALHRALGSLCLYARLDTGQESQEERTAMGVLAEIGRQACGEILTDCLSAESVGRRRLDSL